VTLVPEGSAGQQRVILVMKQPGNAKVLKQAISEIGFAGIVISSDDELRNELEHKNSACIALVDVSGFGNTVWKLCQMLQENEVPFVVLSTPRERNIGSKSLSYGATSVLLKPLAKAPLLQLVKNLISR